MARKVTNDLLKRNLYCCTSDGPIEELLICMDQSCNLVIPKTRADSHLHSSFSHPNILQDIHMENDTTGQDSGPVLIQWGTPLTFESK